MKTATTFLSIALAVITASALSAAAVAADSGFGAAAVEDSRSYTLSEMLTYAVEDEYLAYAEYDAILDTFGEQPPFTNIMGAEATHIALLEPLFAEYGMALPENTARDYVVVPVTLTEAYQAGVEAEIKNIAMYETFLRQELPDDVRTVFLSLQSASQNHLAAFERGGSRAGNIRTDAAGYAGRQGRGRSW